MPSYGSYETVRELSGSGDRFLFAAHKSGQTGEDFAVKVLAKHSFMSGGGIFGESAGGDADAQVRAFEAAVAIQKQAGAAASGVAPILESGSNEEASWFVTRHYPRSVQKLVQGRVLLNAAGLFHIVSAIVGGLTSMKRSCQRTHGNLKASNVLIGAAPKITDTEVALSDPAPGEASQAEEFEKADLNALGKIILQLVRRKEISGSADWMILPLEMSREWREVAGKQADDWLAFCNRLLDPELSLDTFSLEKVSAELANLQPRAPISVRTVAVLTTVMLLGVAALVFFLRPDGQSNVLIYSHPGGVVITVDGGAIGKTPETTNVFLPLALEPGTYRLRGDYKDLDPYVASVTVTTEGKVEVTSESSTSADVAMDVDGRTIVPIYLDYGSLIITSQPPRATITFTNGVSGETPYTNLYARPGPVRFQMVLENHAPWEAPEEVILGVGQDLILGTNLQERAPGQVLVRFSGGPFSSLVSETSGKGLKDFEVPGAKYFDPGKYRFVGVSRNFTPITNDVEILEGDAEKKVPFDFENTKVRLETVPPGVAVFVGGANVSSNAEENKQVTPMVVYWPPDEQVVFRFEKPGYETTNSEPKQLTGGGSLIVRQNLNPILGTLLVTSDPPGAEIFTVTGERLTSVGVTVVDPSTPLRVQQPPGIGVVMARYPGLGSPAPFTNLFALGKMGSHAFQFDYGTLGVTTVPATAEDVALTLNGTPWDSTARPTLYLSNGVHTVTASNGYFGSVTGQVEVVNGGLTNHTLHLGGRLSVTSTPTNATVYEVREGARVRLGVTPFGFPPTEVWVRAESKTYELVHMDTESGKENTKRLPLEVRRGKELNELRWNFLHPDNFINSAGLFMIYLDAPDLLVAATEVSEKQYVEVMGKDSIPGSSDYPVRDVEWAKAQEYCLRLTEKDLAAGKPIGDHVYRLPSADEWSSYASANAAADWDNAQARGTFGNTKEQPALVTDGIRNEFGLFHVRGNVFEWCNDKPGWVIGGSYKQTGRRTPYFGFGGSKQRTFSREASPEIGFRVVLAPRK